MNRLSICRDGKSIQLTAEEMLEAYRRVREDLIEQDLLLRFSDSDVLDNLSEVLFLSNSERGILEDILLVPGSAFLHAFRIAWRICKTLKPTKMPMRICSMKH